MAGGTCAMETDEIEFEWVIQQFSKVKMLMESEAIIDPNKLAAISSNDFYTKVSNLNKVWNLKLECSSNSTYKIILKLHSGSSRFSIKFFILNVFYEKEKLNDETKLYLRKSDGDDYSYPIDPKYLTDERYIFNDELKIICNLVEYGELATRSLPSSKDRPNSLLIDIKTLLASKQFSDVILKVNKTVFKVHKTILSARSPVFAEIFSRKDLKESKTHQVITIENTFYKNLEQFLEFIYTDKIEEDIWDKFELWQLADKYRVKSLKTYCEQSILYELSERSIIYILESADLYEMQDLLDKTVDYFISHHKSMLKSHSDEFNTLRQTNPRLINLILERSRNKY